MKCIGCGSSFVNLDETWTKKGSLNRTSWGPFKQSLYEGFTTNTYCSSCLSNNSRNAFSWTQAQQVAPNRYQIWDKIILKDVPSRYPQCKEDYGTTGMVHKRKPGDYAGIQKTWDKQPPYSSG